MKDKIGYIKTAKRTYPICFNLNVLEDLQDQYGSLSAWGDVVESKEKDSMNIKDLKKGLMLMINEAIDIENEDLPMEERKELVNEKQVGRIISEVGFEETTNIIMNLSAKSTDSGDNSKNE